MSRVSVDWRSASKDNYINFCKKHSSTKLTFDEWRQEEKKKDEGY